MLVAVRAQGQLRDGAGSSGNGGSICMVVVAGRWLHRSYNLQPYRPTSYRPTLRTYGPSAVYKGRQQQMYGDSSS